MKDVASIDRRPYRPRNVAVEVDDLDGQQALTDELGSQHAHLDLDPRIPVLVVWA